MGMQLEGEREKQDGEESGGAGDFDEASYKRLVLGFCLGQN
jgi:hypothetical protein